MAASKKLFCNCFIGGPIYDKENIQYASFKVPKGKLIQCQLVFSKEGMKTTSLFCVKHFDPSDIMKGKFILNNFFPLRLNLRENAIPKYH